MDPQNPDPASTGGPEPEEIPQAPQGASASASAPASEPASTPSLSSPPPPPPPTAQATSQPQPPATRYGASPPPPPKRGFSFRRPGAGAGQKPPASPFAQGSPPPPPPGQDPYTSAPPPPATGYAPQQVGGSAYYPYPNALRSLPVWVWGMVGVVAVACLGGGLLLGILIGLGSKSSSGPVEQPTPVAVTGDATGTIVSITQEPNVTPNNLLGMNIRLTVTANGLKGVPCDALAYFRDAQGEPLKDNNRQYDTTNGTVVASKEFTPETDQATINDLVIFMPYTELDLPDGTYNNLIFHVQLYDTKAKKFFAKSERYTFNATVQK